MGEAVGSGVLVIITSYLSGTNGAYVVITPFTGNCT